MRIKNLVFLVIFLVNAVKGEDILEGRNKACDVLIAIDQPLWEQHDKNMTLLVDLAKEHVQGLNRIYSQQVFVDNYESYYFHLKRVQVAFGICESHLFDEKNCTEQRQVFLKAFDVQSPLDFCLSYVLTYLDFHNGTAGLASVGTVCRPRFNTGFVTMLNFGLERSLDESVITLAHEVAHSFNAAHDNEFAANETECHGQGYIMDELYNSTSRNNSDKFSPCSLRAMKAKLDELTRSSSDNCFRDLNYSEDDSDLQIALCGNGIVEAGEECDCGFTIEECDDPCCYPAFIPAYERSKNTSAIACQTNLRSQCLTRPALIYGFYLPWGFILAMVVLIGLLLRADWYRDKRLFTHITQNQTRIRIVK